MKKLLSHFLVLAASAGISSAASISVNFNSDREAGAELAPGEAAGAPGYITAGWNNFNGLPASPATSPITDNTAGVDSPNAGTLSNNSGTPVATTITWTGNNSWNTNNGITNPDNKLMNGYLDNNATNAASIGIAGVPYAQYSVVAYFGSDGNDRTGTVGLTGSATYSFRTFSQQAGNFPSIYQQTTDTGPALATSPQANYAVWNNLTSPNFTLALTRGSNNSGFHGFQIIEIPEPSLTMLLGICSGAFFLRRRR